MGYELSTYESPGYRKDFWICQPLEADGMRFAAFAASRPCANRMLTYLLDLVGHPKGHGARPLILKGATISPLMGDVVKGHANSPPLATPCEYSEVSAQGWVKSIL